MDEDDREIIYLHEHFDGPDFWTNRRFENCVIRGPGVIALTGYSGVTFEDCYFSDCDWIPVVGQLACGSMIQLTQVYCLKVEFHRLTFVAPPAGVAAFERDVMHLSDPSLRQFLP